MRLVFSFPFVTQFMVCLKKSLKLFKLRVLRR